MGSGPRESRPTDRARMDELAAWKATFAGGLPGQAPSLEPILASGLSGASHGRRLVRLGFAFVTEPGLEVLESIGASLSGWEAASKHWLVGLHFGLTDPRALERIAGSPLSKLHVHGSGGAGYLFHAKVVAIGDQRARTLTALAVGSANLTGAAVGAHSSNFEAVIALVGSPIPSPVADPFNSWWRAAWDASVPASRRRIEEYSRRREELLELNPDMSAMPEPNPLAEVSVGAGLWIEAGAMSGGSRNQVEFNEELAPFFGPPSYGRRILSIEIQGEVWADRPLTHKVTTFGVHIWRLSLPPGFDYAHRVIRFSRVNEGEERIFEVVVTDPGGTECRRWMSESRARGVLGQTSGGRMFGLVW